MSDSNSKTSQQNRAFKLHLLHNYDIGLNTGNAMRRVFKMRLADIKDDLKADKISTIQAVGLYVHALEECSSTCEDKQMEKIAAQANFSREDFDGSTGRLHALKAPTECAHA